MNTYPSTIQLPKKISPCPITEAIVELRFESDTPNDAVFGIVYQTFKTDYPVSEELPILQIPEIIRKQDKASHYRPYYKLTNNDGFLFQVGPKVLSLISIAPYAGWEEFNRRLKDLVEKVKGLDIVKSYTRIGIRYINKFSLNVFDIVNLQIKLPSHPLTNCETFVSSEIPTGDFKSTLQISNSVTSTQKGQNVKYSIIDIDTFVENPQGEINVLINKGHLEEKKLFFALLKPDFVKSNLSPEY